MKSFKYFAEEILYEQERGVINHPGNPLHGKSGTIVRRHLDGSVDVRVVKNGIPTVVRLERHHISLHESINSDIEKLIQSTRNTPTQRDIVGMHDEVRKISSQYGVPSHRIYNKILHDKDAHPSYRAAATNEDVKIDSDAPQFKGKSKSKKHEMAVAAYLELQRKNK